MDLNFFTAYSLVTQSQLPMFKQTVTNLMYFRPFSFIQIWQKFGQQLCKYALLVSSELVACTLKSTANRKLLITQRAIKKIKKSLQVFS